MCLLYMGLQYPMSYQYTKKILNNQDYRNRLHQDKRYLIRWYLILTLLSKKTLIIKHALCVLART